MIDTGILSGSAGLHGALNNTRMALILVVSMLAGCGGGLDSDSFGKTAASPAGIDSALVGRHPAETTTNTGSEGASIGSAAETTPTADAGSSDSASSPTVVSTAGGDQEVATATTVNPTAVAPATTMACRIKGHYVLFEDSEARGVSGYSQIASFLARKDIANFRGVGVLMDWASIERASGQYDWSRLDRITSLASGSNKRYYISPIERSFHKACGASGVPSFIPSEGAVESGDHVKCMARIWEPAVMDRFIALHKAIADRYGKDPNFIGFMEGEVTARTPSLQNDGWRTRMKPQWIRLYREVAAYAPNLMIGNAMGWVPNQDQEELASVLDGFGGGMLSWPDTFAPGYGGGYSGEGWISAAEGSTYGWYQTARKRARSMIIMPQVQVPFIPATLAAHDYIYRFLRDSIQATAIVWGPWHANDSNYTANVVIPTVNKFGGQLSTPACPN